MQKQRYSKVSMERQFVKKKVYFNSYGTNSVSDCVKMSLLSESRPFDETECQKGIKQSSSHFSTHIANRDTKVMERKHRWPLSLLGVQAAQQTLDAIFAVCLFFPRKQKSSSFSFSERKRVLM